jgi:hypothetical protein
VRSFLKRKWLGIPLIAVIITCVVVSMCTGGVLAQFLFNSNNTASVTVSGSGVAMWTDVGLTQSLPVGGAISFGKLNNDLAQPTTNTFTIYLQNTGNTALSPTIQETGLTSPMSLQDATLGNIGSSPIALLPPVFALSSGSVTIRDAENATNTTITMAEGPNPLTVIPTAQNPVYVQFANGEVITITSWTSTAYSGFPNVNVITCLRGQNGTTAQAQPAGAVASIGNITASTLAPQAVKKLTLVLTAPADNSLTLGNTYSFNIDIHADPGAIIP